MPDKSYTQGFRNLIPDVVLAVKKTTDWKTKYQDAIAELEVKESEWKSLDEILRKTIGRLSIAGRGHDSKLDDQLKLIQKLSRQKKDDRLLDAIEKLAQIISSLDNADDAPDENQNADAASVLSELLRKLKLNPDQQSDLRGIGSDLLKSIAKNQGINKVNQQLARLTALINDSCTAASPDDLGTEIVYQLVRLLDIDENGRQQIEKRCQSSKSVTDRELKILAKIINAQINTNGTEGKSINAAISSLLVRLSEVEHAPISTSNIQARLDGEIKGDQWQEILEDIATTIAQTLDQLSDEKHQLEDLIVNITGHFSDLTQFIAESYDDHLSEHQEILSLQQLMQEGVTKIEENVNSAQDISLLKSIVTTNIRLTRDGVKSFIGRAKSRHDTIEDRNAKLTKQISTMKKETSRLKKRLKENSQKLLHDALTGLGSRLAYDERIAQELARSNRYGSTFIYAILDIDRFKRINDKYGHSAGDKALKIIAQIMRKQIRKTDHIFRVGGEEFVILITNTKLSSAEDLVRKIRKAVTDSGFHFRQERVELTLSAGITKSQSGDKVVAIYERADSALYRAKESGRNCQFVA